MYIVYCRLLYSRFKNALAIIIKTHHDNLMKSRIGHVQIAKAQCGTLHGCTLETVSEDYKVIHRHGENREKDVGHLHKECLYKNILMDAVRRKCELEYPTKSKRTFEKVEALTTARREFRLR